MWVMLCRWELVGRKILYQSFWYFANKVWKFFQVFEQFESDDKLCVMYAHKTAVYYQSQARFNTSMHGPSQNNVKLLMAAHQELTEQNNVINKLDRFVTSLLMYSVVRM